MVTNGTAVLGLGNIGPLAAKPVMEGKAVLFKKFAGIDVFDIELDERDPDKLVDIIAALEPTFGGINLEDIKAPECFYIEKKLRERMKIPVFHDDQHGTAIIVGAAVVNGLRVVGKDIGKVKLVVSGAGAAALACLDLLVGLGINDGEHLGHRHQGRGLRRAARRRWTTTRRATPTKTDARTLAEVIEGADVFLGLSAGGVLKSRDGEEDGGQAAHPRARQPEARDPARGRAKAVRDRRGHRHRPLGLPEPGEQRPVLPVHLPRRARRGRDHDQRGDEARRGAARSPTSRTAEQSDIVAVAYGEQNVRFGPEYLIPRPFDPRLIVKIAPAVAKAAMDSGVATRPIDELRRLRDQLNEFVYHSGLIMKPVFTAAKAVAAAHRLRRGRGRARAARRPGGRGRRARRSRSSSAARRWSSGASSATACASSPGADFELVNPETIRAYRDYWKEYHRLTERRGVSEQYAKIEMRRRPTLIGAMMIHQGEADGMLCGTFGTHDLHLHYVDQVIGRRAGVKNYYAMNVLLLPQAHGASSATPT